MRIFFRVLIMERQTDFDTNIATNQFALVLRQKNATKLRTSSTTSTVKNNNIRNKKPGTQNKSVGTKTSIKHQTLTASLLLLCVHHVESCREWQWKAQVHGD